VKNYVAANLQLVNGIFPYQQPTRARFGFIWGLTRKQF